MKKITLKKLEELKKNYLSWSLEYYILDNLPNQVDNADDIFDFINQTLKHGCISGGVRGLIYSKDTHEFFNKFSEEILEIVENIRQECGEIPFELNTNNLAWLGYEETLRNLVINDLLLEI